MHSRSVECLFTITLRSRSRVLVLNHHSKSVECLFSMTPLPRQSRPRSARWTSPATTPWTRGLHSSTFQLNLSRF